MQRYRHAGAYATAMFAFPRHDHDPIEFYETQLMLNCSRAVILEGDNPAGYADLEVFVAPAPLAGEPLYVRRHQAVAPPQRPRADPGEDLLRRPDETSRGLRDVTRLPAADSSRNNRLLR